MRCDIDLLNNDCIEIFQDTYHDHRTALYFCTNPSIRVVLSGKAGFRRLDFSAGELVYNYCGYHLLFQKRVEHKEDQVADPC